MFVQLKTGNLKFFEFLFREIISLKSKSSHKTCSKMNMRTSLFQSIDSCRTFDKKFASFSKCSLNISLLLNNFLILFISNIDSSKINNPLTFVLEHFQSAQYIFQFGLMYNKQLANFNPISAMNNSNLWSRDKSHLNANSN